MSNDLTLLAQELRKAPNVALFSHVSPDGDCLGTMLAIGFALESLGKEVYLYNPDPIPKNLTFLPGVSKIYSSLPEILPETLLFVDCSDLARVNLKRDQLPEDSMILNLDHHISNENFGDINFIDAQASASGEIAFSLIRELDVNIDKKIATNLYTALVTDTGSFQYSNTTPKTHRLVADLLECGITTEVIHHHIYGQKPLAQVNLLRRGLERLELSVEGQVAIMSLNLKDFYESGADINMSEGLVDHARTIQGVEVAALLKEAEPNRIRVSLRSNQWFDVNVTASQFGGGGHMRAAGCTIEMPLDEAKNQLIDVIKEAIKNGRSN